MCLEFRNGGKYGVQDLVQWVAVFRYNRGLQDWDCPELRSALAGNVGGGTAPTLD
jgi:hypothetical protein